MSDIKDDGGPAFPWGEGGQILGGMSLRDYFAAKSMEGLARHMRDYGWEDEILEGYARQAYSIADAMLKQRSAK